MYMLTTTANTAKIGVINGWYFAGTKGDTADAIWVINVCSFTSASAVPGVAFFTALMDATIFGSIGGLVGGTMSGMEAPSCWLMVLVIHSGIDADCSWIAL